MTVPADPPQRHMAIVGQEDAGKRLDRFVAEALSPLSRSRAKALVEGGHVALVGGRTIREPAHRVKLQEEWRVDVPPAEITTLPAQAMDLAVAYEDDHLIVVNKPAGLVVHPAPGNPDRTLVNALLAHCGDSLTGIGGERRPGIVHRLDKDTSGLLVVAKTGIVHADLVSQFSARTVHRRYLALVHGQPRPATGHFSGAIGRSPHDRKRMAVVDSGGRDAATAYCRLLSFAPYASLLLCRLATGRTHQIRVHLSHAGHPLVGDPVYGRRRPRRASTSHQTEMEAAAATLLGAFPRQALHAASLGFRHPASGDSMLFRAEPPADFNKLGAALAGLSGGQWPDTLARAEILDQMLD